MEILFGSEAKIIIHLYFSVKK